VIKATTCLYGVALSEQYCSLIPKLMAQLATLIKINAPCSLSIILGSDDCEGVDRCLKPRLSTPAKYHSNPKAIANYLNDALATEDSAFIRALGNLSRAHGMGAVAEEEIAQVYTDRSAATWIQRSGQC
jgi:hypothetical protein